MNVNKCNTAFKQSYIRLAAYVFVVTIGLMIGFFFSLSSRESLVHLIHSLPTAKPLLAARVLSGLSMVYIVYLSVYKAIRWPLLALFLIKTSLFAFTAGSVFVSFPNAGWLIQILVLFASWFEIVVSHWLWLRCLVFRSVSTPRDFWICSALQTIVCIFDYYIIYPFAASLFIHQ